MNTSNHISSEVRLYLEKYGYAHDPTQQEVERRMKEYGDTMGGPIGDGTPDVTGAVASMTAKAQDLNVTAASKASEATTAVDEKIGSLAHMIRENAPHEGAIATVATAVEGGLESAGSYLEEKKFKNIATDFTALICRYPVQSLLVGVGLGCVLARSTKE